MIEIKTENYQCEDYCGYFGNAVIVPQFEDGYLYAHTDQDKFYLCVNCKGIVNSESYIAEMIGMGCREIEDYPQVAHSMELEQK